MNGRFSLFCIVLLVAFPSVFASRCGLLEEATALNCIAPLVQFADVGSQAMHPSLSNIQQVCKQYVKYQICTAAVRSGCRTSVAPNIEQLYGILCEEKYSNLMREERECLLELERDEEMNECFTNKTIALRDEHPLARSNDEQECRLLQASVHCLVDRESRTSKCREAVKLQMSLVSSIATRNPDVNCRLTIPKRRPAMEICDENGICSCRLPGYAYDKETRKCIDIDECVDFSAGCSQYCTNTVGSFHCSCDEQFYTLAENNRTCLRKDKDPFWLFFAHGQSIWNISTDGKMFQLQRAGLQKTAMLDVDVLERRLYYADIGANVIERMNIDGTFPQSVQNHEVDGMEGIAVDWVGRNLYSLRRTNILVQTLDGRFRRTLYRNKMKLPRAIALHPKLGKLFVTDWSSAAFIAVADMDGSSFKKIVTERVTWPNALTVDIHADKIYWADAFLDIIEVANLDGSARRTIVADSGSVPHVFGMAVAEDFLYWTDWTYRGLLRANKLTGDNITVLAQTALLPYSLKIFHPSMQPMMPTSCETRGCSQLCLLGTNGSSTCQCGEGFKLLMDGKTCESDCDTGYVECGGADPKCISKIYLCDGFAHCDNNVDEENCPPRICLPGQFQCHDNKKCVQSGGLCDGKMDCADNSDELYCPKK